jgi:hypothetical protein
VKGHFSNTYLRSFTTCSDSLLIVSCYQYDSFCNTIRDASRVHYESVANSLGGMSNFITAEAHANEQRFPFVTTNSFEAIGQNVRQHSGVEAISYAPIVLASEVSRWQLYSVENQHWLQESRFTAIQASVHSEEVSVVAADFSDEPILSAVYDVVNETSVVSSMEQDGASGPYLRKFSTCCT